jgi:hypothetical protein
MGDIMLRLMQRLRLGVSFCFAVGLLSLTVVSASAFTRESTGSGDGGNYSFGDPNDQLTDPDNHNSNQGARPFGSNGPTVQFGVQQGPFSPLSTFGGRSNGYNSTPDPYYGSSLNGK